MAQPTDRIPTDDQSTGCLGILLRLFWMVGGVPILIFLGLGIVLKHDQLLLIIFYWITVIAIIMARLVDIRIFRGETRDGKPATSRDWLRHAAVVLASSCVFFLVIMLFKIFRVFH